MSLLRSGSLFARLAVLSGCTALSFVSVQAVQNVTRGPWYPLGFGGGGFMMSVTTYPTTGTGPYSVLTGCDSSAGFVSFDAGGTWTHLADPLVMGGTKQDGKSVFVSAEFDPADPTKFFMGEGSKIYHIKPSNGQYVYNAVLPDATGGISSICFVPGNPLIGYASTGGVRPFLNSGFSRTLGDTVYPNNIPRIYKTTNGGVDWTALTAADTTNGQYLIDASTTGTIFRLVAMTANRVYAASDVGLFKTTDGGQTWTKIQTGPLSGQLPHDATFGLAVMPGAGASSDRVYVTLQPYPSIKDYLNDPSSYAGSNLSGLYLSSDSGTTWQEIELTDHAGHTAEKIPGTWGDASHLFDVVVVAGATSDRIYVAYQNADTNANGYTNGNDWRKSGVLRSKDGGATFEMLNTYGVDDIYINSFLPQRLAVHALSQTQDEVFVTGVEAGQFKGTEVGGAMTFSSLSSTTTNPSGITMPNGTADAYFRGWGLEAHLGGRMAIDRNEPSVLYYNDKDRGFWKSLDAGHSFRYLYNPGLGNQGDGRGCFPDPDNSSVVYGYVGKKDYRLADLTYPHFVTSTTAGEPTSAFEDGWSDFIDPHNSLVAPLNDLFVWDIALDPTVLAPNQVAADRTLTMAVGDGPFSLFKIVAHLGSGTYDVYLSYIQQNDGVTGPATLNFVTPGAADIKKVEFAVDDAAQLYLDNYALSSAAGSDNENFDAGWPGTGWTKDKTSLSSITAQTGFSSPSAGAINLNSVNGGGITGHAGAVRTLPFTAANGDVTVTADLMPWFSAGKYSINLYDSHDALVASVIVTSTGQVKAQSYESNQVKTFTLPGVVRAPVDHAGVYRRSSGTWTNLAASPMEPTVCLRQLELDPADPAKMFALDTNYHGGLYEYDGAAWAKSYSADQPRAFAVIPDPAGSGDNFVVIAESSGGVSKVSRRKPGTTTFVTLPNIQLARSDIVYVCLTPYGAKGLFIGTSNGVKFIDDITQSDENAVTAVDVNDGLGYGSIYNLDLISSTAGDTLYAGRPGSGSMRADFLPFTATYQYDVGQGVFADDQRYYPKAAMDGFTPFPDASWQVPVLPTVFGAAREHLAAFTTADSDKTSTAASLTTLQLSKDATIYVAVANDANGAPMAPTWLTNSSPPFVAGETFNLQLRNTAQTQSMTLYSRLLAKNTPVTLGGAANGITAPPVNYLVLAAPQPDFSTDFSQDPAADWNTTGGWTWNSTGQRYQASSANNSVATTKTSMTDASIEARLKTPNGSWPVGSSAGLVARYDQANNNYYRFVYVPGTQTVQIVRVRSGVATTLVAGQYALSLATGYHNFEFAVRNDQLIGSIDGAIVLTTTDRDPALKLDDGTFGLFSANNATLFDDYHQFSY